MFRSDSVCRSRCPCCLRVSVKRFLTVKVVELSSMLALSLASCKCCSGRSSAFRFDLAAWRVVSSLEVVCVVSLLQLGPGWLMGFCLSFSAGNEKSKVSDVDGAGVVML